MTNVLPWPHQAPRIARYVWPQLQEPQVEKTYSTQHLLENFMLEDLDHAGTVFQRAVNAYKASGYVAYQNELEAIHIRLSAVLDRVQNEIQIERNRA